MFRKNKHPPGTNKAPFRQFSRCVLKYSSSISILFRFEGIRLVHPVPALGVRNIASFPQSSMTILCRYVSDAWLFWWSHVKIICNVVIVPSQSNDRSASKWDSASVVRTRIHMIRSYSMHVIKFSVFQRVEIL